MEESDIVKKIEELAELIEGKMAITIYANNTWKQIGGSPRLCYPEEERLMLNNKAEMVDEIILLRKEINKLNKQIKSKRTNNK